MNTGVLIAIIVIVVVIVALAVVLAQRKRTQGLRDQFGPEYERTLARSGDRKSAESFAKKALAGDGFTLEDFREQLRQIKKLGSMKSIMKMLPSVGPMAGMAQAAENVDEGQLTRVESIINSMTNKERQNADLINGSRRKRIANGSGTSVQEVNNLLRQYSQMSKVFKAMGGGMGGGMKAQQRLMSQMQQQKQRFGR